MGASPEPPQALGIGDEGTVQPQAAPIVPQEWKAARKARAAEWFQQAVEKQQRKHEAKLQQEQKAADEAAQQATLQANQQARVQQVQQAQHDTRLQLEANICAASAEAVARQAPAEHALRWPRHTPLRPLVVLGTRPSDSAPLREQLFIRGLVSTLMANAQASGSEAGQAQDEQGDEAASLGLRVRGFRGLMRAGCAGADLVWWDPLHPLDAPDLCRLEALNACMVAIIVLTRAYVNSPQYKAERDLAFSRLYAHSPNHPFLLVTLSFTSDPLEATPSLAPPQPPPGYPLDLDNIFRATVINPAATPEAQVLSAVSAVSSALSSQGHLPVTLPSCPRVHFHPTTALESLQQPGGLLHNPSSLLRHTLITPDLAGVTSGLVARVRAAAVGQQPADAGDTLLDGGDGGGLDPAPQQQQLTLGYSSLQAPMHGLLRNTLAGRGYSAGASWINAKQGLAAAQTTLSRTGSLSGTGRLSLSSTQMSATTYPSATATSLTSTGRQSLASTWAGTTPVLTKPLASWSVHDVQVWLLSLGKTLGRQAPSFLRYGIDGRLLSALTPKDLAEVTGSRVGNAGQQALLAARDQLLAAVGLEPPQQMEGIDDPLLLTLSDEQLSEVFSEVLRYYDKDLSGDLDNTELNNLLAAAGLRLSGKEISEVRDEYDVDDDGRLDGSEALSLMWDLWRLLIASRDATAWNIPSRLQLLQEGFTSQLDQELPEVATGHAGPGVGHSPAPAHPSTSGSTGEPGPSFVPALQPVGQHRGLRVSIKEQPDEQLATGAGGVYQEMNTEEPMGRVSWGEVNMTGGPLLYDKPATPPGASVVATVNRPTAGSPTKSARKAFTHTTSSGIRLSAAALAAAGGAPLAGEDEDEEQGGEGGACNDAPWGGAFDTKSRRYVPITTAAPGGGGAGPLGDDASRSQTGGSTVATNLEVFADPAVISSTTLRPTVEPSDLAASLAATLADADLQRTGALTPPALRAALAAAYGPATVLAGSGTSAILGLVPSAAQQEVVASGTCLGSETQGGLRTVVTPVTVMTPANLDLDTLGSCEVTPYELRLLAALSMDLSASGPTGASRQGSLRAGGGAGDHQQLVDFVSYTNRAVAAVAVSQQALMEGVYSSNGTQRLLYKLHAQVYPFSVGYLHLGSEGSAASITGGSYTASAQQGKHRSTRPSAVRISDQGHGDGGSAAGNVAGGDQPEVLAGGRGQAGGRHAGTSRAAVMSLETAALGNTTVPFEEAPALLDTLTSKLGVSLPFLVRAGILQEAANAADRISGSGNEVTAWSTCAAHMLHVWHSLQTPILAAQFY